jgi:hypothetical protein
MVVSSDVFPDYAVKQVFYEQNLERSDELVINGMQSQLLTRSLCSILKPSLLSCLHNKRIYINENDIEKGVILSLYPYIEGPANAGHVLESVEFIKFVYEHLQLLLTHIQKNSPLEVKKEFKLSQETLTRLQKYCEGIIRGFVQKMSQSCTNNTVSYRRFEQTMGEVMGDPYYITSDHVYTPFT